MWQSSLSDSRQSKFGWNLAGGSIEISDYGAEVKNWAPLNYSVFTRQVQLGRIAISGGITLLFILAFQLISINSTLPSPQYFTTSHAGGQQIRKASSNIHVSYEQPRMFYKFYPLTWSRGKTPTEFNYVTSHVMKYLTCPSMITYYSNFFK